MRRPTAQQTFALGSCVVTPGFNRIECGGRTMRIEPRVMDVLTALADRPGEVVDRSDLIDRVWGADRGSDEALSRAVSLLRRAFSELGAGQMIVTIPKRGYRLVPPVGTTEPPPDTGQGPSVPRPAPAAVVRKSRSAIGLMAVCLLAAAGLAALSFIVLGRTGRPAGPELQTIEGGIAIAVLPFVPFSDDRDDLHFSHGLTEELINALVRVPDLGVAARTSSFQYRDRRSDVRDIGRELGVDYLVEGSVRRDAGRVRVTAQLIRASDGLHVWSAVEEEETGSSFALQDEIVREICRALELRLGVGYGEDVQPRRAIDPQAAALYFEGLHQVADGLREDGAARAGYAALRAATELQPDFAEAWVALAETGVFWADGPLAQDYGDFRLRLREDLDKALSLAPENYRTHTTAARFFGMVELDIDRAAYHLERAEALAPKAAPVLYARGWYAWLTGDVGTAIEVYERALLLDPLNEQARFSIALKRAMLGETSDAFAYMRACQKADCLQEGFVAYATAAVLMRGDEAEKAWWAPVYVDFERKLEGLPASAKPDATKIMPAFAALRFGDPDAAMKVAEAEDIFARSPITNHINMWGPTLTGVLDPDLFVDALVSAHERGELFSHGLAMSPFYGANPYPEEIVSHPRYRELWREPGLARLAALRRANGWEEGLPSAP